MPARCPRLPLSIAVLCAMLLIADEGKAQVAIVSVVNAASFLSVLGGSAIHGGTDLVPGGGSLATMFCTGIASNPGVYTAPSSSPLPFVLGGIEVRVNGALAPLLAVIIPPAGQDGYTQVNFQVPLERNGNLDPANSERSIENVVFRVSSTDGFASRTFYGFRGVGGFFTDASGYVIAQHAGDFSRVTVQNPAHAGETIVAYADDFFEVWPPPPMGYPVPVQPAFVSDTSLLGGDLFFAFQHLYLQSYLPSNLYGGTATPTTSPVQILFEGLAPAMIGVEQINFVVPANQAPGDWSLFFNVGAQPLVNSISSPDVKLPIR